MTAHAIWPRKGLFDEAGRWLVQGRVTLPDGTWSTDTAAFVVAANLCPAEVG